MAAVTSSEAVLDEGHPAVGELADRVLATGLGDEAQRLDGQVVVLLVEALAAVLGEREDLGRTASATARGGPRLARLDRALLDQLVEVAAHGGGCEVEPLAERGRRGGPVLEDRPGDALARRVVSLEYHNTSVPLMT